MLTGKAKSKDMPILCQDSTISQTLAIKDGDNMRKGYLYEIVNKINNKKYFGTTFQNPPNRRWNNHKYIAKHRIRSTPLYNAMNKYGIDNFKFNIILSDVPENELHKLEYDYIKENNTQNIDNGYNLADGGKYPTGFKIPEHIIEKRRNAMTGKNNHFFGKTHTEEAKMKISKSKIGRRHTSESKKKMSESRKGENSSFYGKKGDKHPFFGYKKSKEQILKSALKHPLRKKINMLNPHTKDVIATFYSKSEACRWIKDNTKFGSEIRSMLSTLNYGIRNDKVVYGYNWEIVE